jgi:hypothetical protein
MVYCLTNSIGTEATGVAYRRVTGGRICIQRPKVIEMYNIIRRKRELKTPDGQTKKLSTKSTLLAVEAHHGGRRFLERRSQTSRPYYKQSSTH